MKNLDLGENRKMRISYFFPTGILLEILVGNPSGTATKGAGRLLGEIKGDEGKIRNESMVQGNIREKMYSYKPPCPSSLLLLF